ncbi:2499_t:CDS:2, partial [Gigaspora rosea]
MRVFRIKRKIKPREFVSISSKRGSFRFHKGTWSFVRSPGTWLRTEVTEEMQINSQEAASRQLVSPMAGIIRKTNDPLPPVVNGWISNDEDSDVELDLSDNQKLIRNVFLKLLDESKENEAGKTLKESLFLNDIVDLTKIKKVWKKHQSLDFCKQFIAESCNRVEVPNLVRKSCVNGCFDPFVHEGHDIAQDTMNIWSKGYRYKEIEDQVKLGTNAKKLLNKLLEEVP